MAFQHSLVNGDGGLVSTGKEEMYHNSVEDAFVIFNTHPSGSTRFVEHSRALTSGHTRSSEACRMVLKKASPPRRRRKDPNRPRGYVSAFNFFVKDKRSAYVRDAQVTRLSLLVWTCLPRPPGVFFTISNCCHPPNEHLCAPLQYVRVFLPAITMK